MSSTSRPMRLALALPALLLLPIAALGAQGRATRTGTASFTLPQLLSYPFPVELSAAPTGARIAWVFEEAGVRNVYAAEGPTWSARRLTDQRADDGQELTNVALSPDGQWVVYVRGGEHGANWAGEGGLQPDPASSPVQPQLELWAVPFAGGAAKLLATNADAPVISPAGERVVFQRGRELWTVPLDGSAPAKRLFFARGGSSSPVWSPDGQKLAFVSNRDDHAFVGIYVNDSTPITWLAPSTNRDMMPRWSPDGRRVAFVRVSGSGGAPAPLLEQTSRPWQIWVADVATGEGRAVWKSPETLRGSLPTTNGGANLAWGAGDRLVFLSDVDGWPHLYSVSAAGGTPLLLTPGKFMCEHISLAPDGRSVLYSANTGPAAEDIDRRHIFRVPVDRAAPEALVRAGGSAMEWMPVMTGDGRTVAFIGATAQRPPLPMVVAATGGTPTVLGAERIPADFPAAQLVTPEMVTFTAADGLTIHGQLFEPAGATARGGKHPAVIFIHGGPPRQMLLGWNYSGYYTNSYAVNQYLASRGFVVLAVNYRLGIGYGHDFHHPPRAGMAGASEYQDIVAAGRYLQSLPQVDGRRIGLWGGSYGGYLTALGLARNSDLFAAGVDLHGVHDWTSDEGRRLGADSWRYERGDLDSAATVAWRSSPVSAVATWRSPVLLIQGDDDRNVRFHQTVDLARRLEAAGVPFEELVIPDDTHHFLRHANWVRADSATAAFLERTLRDGATPRAASGAAGRGQ